mgnify:CR=1 FL=1
MRKEIPTPVVIAVIAALVALAGFGIWRIAQGPAEFAPPAVEKVIPRYVADAMPPAELERMKQQGFRVEDIDPAQQDIPIPGQ